MKKYFITFFGTIILLIIIAILLNILNPFDSKALEELIKADEIRTREELRIVVNSLVKQGLIFEFLNIRSLAIISGLLALALGSGSIFLGMVIERLLLIKFYQEVSLTKAVRRAVLVVIGVFGVFFLNLFGVEDPVLLAHGVFIIGLFIVVEKLWKIENKIREEYRHTDTDKYQENHPPARLIIDKVSSWVALVRFSISAAYNSAKNSISKSEKPGVKSDVVSSPQVEIGKNQQNYLDKNHE